MKRAWAVWAVLALAGCGSKENAPPAAGTPPPGPQTPSSVVGQVQIVDLDGRPLANMAPIATLSPNAFERPIAQGELSGQDGRTSVVFPSDQRVFVRGWDPALRYFTNNFYEVPAGPGSETGLMTLVMVPGASLDAVLLGPGEQPLANEHVDLMMFHPTKGAWWPETATTDARGAVHFPSLPAGSYTLQFKTAGGAQVEAPDVKLPPAGHTDLGRILLE